MPVRVAILGDVSSEWAIVPPPSWAEPVRTATWPFMDGFNVVPQPGGAWTLDALLRAALSTIRPDPLVTVLPRQRDVKFDDKNRHHMLVLGRYPKGLGVDGDGRARRSPDKVYRIRHVIGRRGEAAPTTSATFRAWGEPPADVLVICDRNHAFRTAGRGVLRSGFEKVCGRDPKAIVFWECSEPVRDPHGPDAPPQIVDALEECKLIENTILVTSDNGLRESAINLSDELSLERSVDDFHSAWEQGHNTSIKDIRKCRGVIVRLGIDAALCWVRDAKNPQQWNRTLYYRPERTPGFGQDELGKMVGYTAILTATLIHAFVSAPHDQYSAIDSGIKAGLGRCCSHYRQGFGPSDQNPNQKWCETLFKTEPASDIAVLPLSGEKSLKPRWSILSNQVPGEKAYTSADQMVKRGSSAAKDWNLPLAQFGKLVTADRQEIENYRGLQNLLSKYFDEGSWTRPLSLAVFGPPGCGKSFGVTQVAESITASRPSVEIESLTFNLAQFGSVSDLAHAFHRARDLVLANKVPLVFLDEFDAPFEGRAFGWLKYLLSPMQDGMFRDGQTDFHIARCVLIFIGGLNESFGQLEGRSRSPEFKEAKGPDFVSRLRHHLDIKGPDQGPDDDRLIRRAIVLHGVLRNKMKSIFDDKNEAQIDPGVVRAFLGVGEYKHGIRSMEAIVDMSRASISRRRFQVASLPPEHQLEMHVNAREFLNLVEGVE